MPDQATQPVQPLLLEPIAAGSMRDCFAHPRDRTLCIKVPRGVQGLKVCEREARYVARIVRRFPGADVARVPRYLDRVLTDRGTGWVQQRVMNADSTPAPLLRDCFDASGYHRGRTEWDAAFAEFRHWATTQPMQLRDLTPSNLCVRTLPYGALQFVPIDGFSPRSVLQRLLPTQRYAAACNRKQLERFALTDVQRLIHAVERENVRHETASLIPRSTHLIERSRH